MASFNPYSFAVNRQSQISACYNLSKRKRSYEPQRTEKSMRRCNCGICHRGCSGNAGGVSQPGADPAVLWQTHLRLYKGSSGSRQRILPQGSYTDNTQTMLATAECLIECRRMDPARQADALLSWFLNTVPHRTPSAANLQSLQAPVHGQAVEQKRRFQQLLCCGHAHDAHRAFLQPLPRRHSRARPSTTASSPTMSPGSRGFSRRRIPHGPAAAVR